MQVVFCYSLPSNNETDELNDTETIASQKTVIITIISRAVEAASVILDQTGVIQVNKNISNIH